MHHALIWLLAIELLGLLALPFNFSLFRRLPDRGINLNKPVALLVASYFLWVLGLTQIIPNTRYTIVAILIVLTFAAAILWRRQFTEIRSFVWQERFALLLGELVFLAFYFLWLSVVSLSPSINHTEKPMDFAFLNAILRSRYFPPEDPWLAGHPISYYYFGHFMMGFLTKFTGIPSNISYNLSIALIPTLVGLAAFGLAYDLVRLSGAKLRVAVLYALFAPLFMVLIGNLEGVLEFIKARGWGSDSFWQWVSIKGLQTSQGSDSGVFPREHWWWWRATRVIDTVVDGRSLDYTITEFPFFSFLLGDLHAHVTSLPFLILSLTLGLNFYMSQERVGFSWLRDNPWESLAIALSLGALAFINIWDFPIFAVIFVFLAFMKSCMEEGNIKRALARALVMVIPILGVAVFLYLPFYATLGSQASGVLPLRNVSTRPFFFFLIWGPFLMISISFLLRQLWSVHQRGPQGEGGKLDHRALLLVLAIILLPFVVWAIIELFLGVFEDGLLKALLAVGSRFGKLAPLLAIVGVALYSVLLRSRIGDRRPDGYPVSQHITTGTEEGRSPSFEGLGVSPRNISPLPSPFERRGTKGDEGRERGPKPHEVSSRQDQKALVFPLLLIAAAYYLLLGVELFYLSDLFGNRMNTVFKAYYEAWLFLAIASTYGLYYWRSRPSPLVPNRRPLAQSRLGIGKTLSFTWIALVAALLLASLYYPIGAVLDKTKRSSDGATLDGLAFIKRQSSGEYDAIKWLRDEASWGRSVEAVGDDYSEYGRISASTGLPTILGWQFHEHQWRGSTRLFDGRKDEVTQIYTSADIEQAKKLLDKYRIRYVIITNRERSRYMDGDLDKFGQFMRTVFHSRDVIVYERDLLEK